MKIEEQLQQAKAINARTRAIAHDLNNLLTVIGGYSGLIRETAQDLPSGVMEGLNEIHRSVERAALLTRELSLTLRMDQSAHEESPDTRSSSPAETILIVDDEAPIRALMCEILRRAQYEVLEALGHEDAVQTLRRYGNRICLLITDVMLPGASGPSLASVAVQMQPDLRVLLMSGYTRDVSGSSNLLHSKQAFLQKPFTPQILVEKVKEVLKAP